VGEILVTYIEDTEGSEIGPRRQTEPPDLIIKHAVSPGSEMPGTNG